MPTETPAKALREQARAHRSRGARRPVRRRTDVEPADSDADQFDMFADESTDEEH